MPRSWTAGEALGTKHRDGHNNTAYEDEANIFTTDQVINGQLTRNADTTTPSTQAFGDAAAAGTGTKSSNADHKHGIPANPVTSHEAASDPHTGYVLESLVDAKGDIIAATAADAISRLAVGANGTVLTADSAQSTGLAWASVGGYWDATITKAADQSVISSTTLVDDTHLQFSITANSFYEFQVNLIVVGTSIGDIKIGFVGTTGTLSGAYQGYGLAVNDAAQNVVGTTLTTTTTWGLSNSTTSPRVIPLRGSFTNTTSTTFKLQWAQATSDSTNSTVKAGSRLSYRVVA
jgi:hypothetical protein